MIPTIICNHLNDSPDMRDAINIAMGALGVDCGGFEPVWRISNFKREIDFEKFCLAISETIESGCFNIDVNAIMNSTSGISFLFSALNLSNNERFNFSITLNEIDSEPFFRFLVDSDEMLGSRFVRDSEGVLRKMDSLVKNPFSFYRTGSGYISFTLSGIEGEMERSFTARRDYGDYIFRIEPGEMVFNRYSVDVSLSGLNLEPGSDEVTPRTEFFAKLFNDCPESKRALEVLKKSTDETKFHVIEEKAFGGFRILIPHETDSFLSLGDFYIEKTVNHRVSNEDLFVFRSITNGALFYPQRDSWRDSIGNRIFFSLDALKSAKIDGEKLFITISADERANFQIVNKEMLIEELKKVLEKTKDGAIGALILQLEL